MKIFLSGFGFILMCNENESSIYINLLGFVLFVIGGISLIKKSMSEEELNKLSNK